jgi:hypothetical protein
VRRGRPGVFQALLATRKKKWADLYTPMKQYFIDSDAGRERELAMADRALLNSGIAAGNLSGHRARIMAEVTRSENQKEYDVPPPAGAPAVSPAALPAGELATYCRAWRARKSAEAAEAAAVAEAMAAPTAAPVGMELEPTAAPA